MLTVQQVADRLGIDVSQVRRLARQYDMGTKFGPVWLFTEDDVERLKRRPPPGRPKL